MKKILNLLPGSKLNVYIIEGGANNPIVRQVTATLTQDDRLKVDDTLYPWESVGADPAEAIEIEIRKIEEQKRKLDVWISSLQQYRRTKFPRHPVLSEAEFRKKYPNLYASQRLADLSPSELEQLENQARFQNSKYDHPG